MRILFCNYEYPPLGGGGGVLNALLAQELAKHHEVSVLTSRANGLPAEADEAGVHILRVPVLLRRQEAVASLASMMAFILQGIRVGRTLVQTHEYDVINTHFVLPSGPVGQALAHVTNLPNVLTLHGGDLYDPSKFLSPHRHLLLRTWIRWLLRQSHIVVGQSQNTLANMRHFYASEIEGVRIPLGIQRPALGAARRSDYQCEEGEVLLLTVGRLIARKGISQLIQVIDHLREERVRLLIMGTGPLESSLKEEVRKKRLEKKVLFLGHVNDEEKFRILHMGDLYVSTSQHEGFGLVFLEAMACSLPVVCYDHGGQTDFLENQVTGYLAPCDNLERFTECCRNLIHDSALRQQMGHENKRRVEALFIERCAEQYEKIFQEAIARCQMETLVSVSSAKKLPLGDAAAHFLTASHKGQLLPAPLRSSLG